MGTPWGLGTVLGWWSDYLKIIGRLG
jgi:hypothetical protein